jgi:GT2 family glycosyltransferase
MSLTGHSTQSTSLRSAQPHPNDGTPCAKHRTAETLTIDIVVPSYRLRSEFLHAVASLRQPPGVNLSVFIVVDCPGADLHEVRRAADGVKNIVILVNNVNVGASESRNRGINAGTGDYILFLDDDVEPWEDLVAEYVSAIRSDEGNHAGFVGVVRFPPACNGFTRGVIQSGVLTFFGLAAQKGRMPWGVTANLCLRRRALGTTRFSNRFPLGGGGEDIDLCLRVRENDGGREFLSVPRAIASHLWWGSGERCYGRFVRWAYGDSTLPGRHPQYRFTNWPTMWETWIVLGILWAALPKTTVIVGVGVIASVVSEFLVDYARRRRRQGYAAFLDSAEAVLIRLCLDLGRVLSSVSRFRPRGFLEHFDFFCTGQHIRSERRVAAVKTAIVIGVVAAVAVWHSW